MNKNKRSILYIINDILRDTNGRRNLLNLYRGAIPRSLSMATYFSVVFTMYETLKRLSIK